MRTEKEGPTESYPWAPGNDPVLLELYKKKGLAEARLEGARHRKWLQPMLDMDTTELVAAAKKADDEYYAALEERGR